MLATITSIAGIAGLILTIGLLAWQTRAAAKQAEIANAIAGATVLYACASGLREVLRLFVERPALRSYFYDARSARIRPMSARASSASRKCSQTRSKTGW